MIPKLYPFVKECEVDRPGTVLQEDRAPTHNSHYQTEVMDLWKILKLLWPGNSPDLNAIEPTWNWMKRETTKYGGFTSKAKMKVAWLKCQEEMSQEKIQAQINRIYDHVQEVILLKGRNNYKEGRKKGQEKLLIRA